ncbi:MULTISPECIES: SCO6881 family protein [unclassified Streptomyces]|nr:hypothetical protein GA0115252_13717 [Streptomyces sp. DfronAA-171]
MAVCDLPLMDKVCGAIDFAQNPGGTVTNAVGAWIAKSVGELAASAADLAARTVDATTAIDLDAHWFRQNYELILPIGLVVIVATFCLQLVQAAFRRDERALAQAVTGTVTGVLFSFCAVSFTSVAITVTDSLSDSLFATAHTSIAEAVRRLVGGPDLGTMYSNGWVTPTFVALACSIGAFLYWCVMVARKVGVLVMVTVAVFAGAGGGWEAAKRWRRGWIEATAALVFSKLLMTVVFLIGVSALGQTHARDGVGAVSDALAGLVVMVLVLLCPYACYKFVHWATDSGGHDDLHRTAVAGVTVAANAAKTAGRLAFQASTGVPAPQGPPSVPGTDSSGTAAGIDPSGGSRLSKEGIDGGPEQSPVRFRYGEDPDAEGDRGTPLIRRPGIPPLITRAPADAPAPSTAPAPPDLRKANMPAPDPGSPPPEGS